MSSPAISSPATASSVWRYGVLWTVGVMAVSWIQYLRIGELPKWELVEHTVIWAMGIAVLVAGHRRIEARWRERNELLARLATSDERWRAAMESTGDGLWDWDGEHGTCFYSATWKAMIGYGDNEFPSTHEAWVEHMHPEDRARVLESVADNLAGRKHEHAVEYRLRCKDGSYRWVLGRGRVIARAPDGTALRAVGTHTDITERRREQEQARLVQERHRFFLEHAADPMIAYYLEAGGAISCLIEVNAAACRLSGYAREQLLKLSARDLEFGWSQEKSAPRLQEFRANRHVRFETNLKRADGGICPVEFQAEVLGYGGRSVVLATVRDIRSQRETAMRQRCEAEQARLFVELYAHAAELSESELLSHVLGVTARVTDSGWAFMRRWSAKVPGETTWARGTDAAGGLPVNDPGDREYSWQGDLSGVEPIVRNACETDSGAQHRRSIMVPLQTEGAVEWVLGVTGKGADYGAEDVARVQLIGAEWQKAVQQQRSERALRLERQRFRALFDHAPLGIMEEDFSAVQARFEELRAAGVVDFRAYFQTHPEEVRALADRVKVLLVNRRSAELFGVNRIDVLLGPISRHVTDEAWGVIAEKFVALAEGKTRFTAEVPAVHASGEVRFFALTFVVEPGHEAKLSRVIVSFSDVTERRRAEAELRKLARAVEQSPVAIVITDRTGLIEYANPQFAKITGYALNEVVGCNPRVLKSGVQDEAVYRELWTTLAAGREWRGELCNRRKDGTLFWEMASISPVADEAGHITHFLAVKEDITARRATEAQLREQAALLAVTRDAFIVVDLTWVVRFWNRGAERIYGWTSAEAVGQPLSSLLYAPGQSGPRQARETIVAVGEWSGELAQQSKSGAGIVTRAQGLLLRDANGKPTSILLTSSDITEAKQLEARFLRAQRLQSLGALASGVAHDLNNVLSPIMMSVELLRPLAVTEPDREVLRLLSDSARRGADVVRQLLLFGRGSDAPSETVDLAKVVKEILRMVRETFPRNLTIKSQVSRDVWPIRGHATEIYQVLLNFCVNARDAMPDGGTLTLEVVNHHLDEVMARQNPGARAGRYVTLKVTDTGMGIAPDIIDRIFDPFFTTKEQGKGSGLGLSTVVGIAKSHGGFVTVTSQRGEGTEFRVYLPATTAEGGEPARQSSGVVWQGRGEMILVVDDEPAIRQVLGRSLTENGYRVVLAANGAEALPLCRQHRSELAAVVLDMMMPGLDGPQVLKSLREIAPSVPIIACSGLHSYGATLEKLDLPHVRFMAKPIEIPALLEKMRIVVDAHGDRRGAPDLVTQ